METLLGNITWAQFLATVLLILGTYYSYIAYKYYPEEIRNLLRKKYQPGLNPFSFEQVEEATQPLAIKPQQAPVAQHASFEEPADDTFDRIEELIDRIKPVITASAGSAENTQLGHNLSAILREYPDLRTSSFHPAIIELIQTEINHTGSTAPDESEIMLLWEKGVEP